jgi:hypothetical protein
MSEPDRNYFRRRADEEKLAMRRAAVPAAAKAHKALAERYSELSMSANGSTAEQATPANGD